MEKTVERVRNELQNELQKEQAGLKMEGQELWKK